MPYTPQTWADGSGGGTPISAARLAFMEAGIDSAHTTADDLVSAASGALNVRSYGAVGDGTADDLAAINSAIAALPAGGRLIFPPGYTFKVSDTVTVRRIPGVTIIGDGATISSTATGATARVLSVESCVGATVRGITLRHANTGTRQVDADGLTIRRCADVLVENVHATAVYSIGIRVAGSIRTTVRDCRVDNTMADGIAVYGAALDATGGAITTGTNTLTSATAYFTSADIGGFVQVTGAGTAGGNLTATITGYTAPNTVTLSVNASTTVASASVKVVRHSERVTISGCHTTSTADDSISSVGYLTLGGVPVAANRDITIMGNTVRSGGARGILLCGTTRAVVADNIVDTVVAGGIFVTTEPNAGGSFGCQDVSIVGNNLVNCNTNYPTSNYGSIGVGSGLDAYPVTEVTVRDNIVRGGGSYYLLVGADSGTNTAVSTTDVDVRDNMCLGGNANNAAVNVIKATDVAVVGNTVDKAYRSAVSVSSGTAGVLLVADNNVTAADQGAGGFLPIDVTTATLVARNLVDGAMDGSPIVVVPPASTWYADVSAAWWGVNGAVLQRFTVTQPTRARYVNLHIGTASGNIQVGVVKLSATNPLAWTSRPMNSGVIACPAAGPQRVDLGSTVLAPGEYALFFWADNTTVAVTHYLGSAGYTASRLILAGTYVGGLGTTGAGSLGNRYVAGLTLEGV